MTGGSLLPGVTHASDTGTRIPSLGTRPSLRGRRESGSETIESPSHVFVTKSATVKTVVTVAVPTALSWGGKFRSWVAKIVPLGGKLRTWVAKIVPPMSHKCTASPSLFGGEASPPPPPPPPPVDI